jgi:ATP-dependent DNA helicase PIF1
MELSEQQQNVFESFKQKENIFMTGPGGSGKSFLIKMIYDWCKENNKDVQVCALTGCAAVLLQCRAKTVHSWAGIGLAQGEEIDIVMRVANNKFKKKNWMFTELLIIDEVSMMSSKLLGILDAIGKKVRKNDKPFGGIQLLFSGDFYQLPPVGSNNEDESSKFCFENPIWDTMFHKQIALDTIYRQSDQTYASILNQIREGKLNKSAFNQLQSRLIDYNASENETIKPTKLMPRRIDVNKINESEMKKLETEEKTYVMQVAERQLFNLTSEQVFKLARTPHQQIEYELENIRASIMPEEKICLKIGAQVMCVVNLDTEIDNPIVNGSCGLVIDFKEDLPVVKFKNGHTRLINYHVWESEHIKGVGIKQLPLILAWAITIHKAQGTTLELAEIDIGTGIFECGQSYVALSRVKDINGLYLTGFNPNKIKVSRKVKEYYSKFKI